MRGWVVLEGADSSGKTTLGHRLRDLFGGNYTHSVPRKVEEMYEYHKVVTDFAVVSSRKELVVSDRHWVSETIYGPAFRSFAGFGSSEAQFFDNMIRKHGLYVLCVPADQERQEARFLADRAGGKHEHFDDVREVMRLYAKLVNGDASYTEPGYLGDRIRAKDFVARGRCLVYDMDVDGKDVDGFIVKMREMLLS